MLYFCRYEGQECILANYSFAQRISTIGNCYTFNASEDETILSTISDDQPYGLELILDAEV